MGLPLKVRARLGSASRSKKFRGIKQEIDRLENAEKRLENASDEIMTEIAELEGVDEKLLKDKPQAAWTREKLWQTIIQDFVGAAFGAMFFVVTQEVWALSARLTLLTGSVLIALGFLLGFALVFESRRRKFLSKRVEKSAWHRAIEIYVISFATALLFILVLGTASEPVMIAKQTILITLPAVVSAATADLLFF